MQNNLLNLVRDARAFLEQQLPYRATFEREEVEPCPIPLKKAPKLEKQVQQIEAETKNPDSSTSKPASPKPKIETKKSGWELQSMPQVEENTLFRDKLATYMSTCDAIVPVRLVLPEENPSHRLFLENVSKVITRAFAPACVVVAQDVNFSDPHIKRILAPVSLLKKSYNQVQSHQLFSADGLVFIPMENLDLYAHDLNCKRALWTTIQHSFQS